MIIVVGIIVLVLVFLFIYVSKQPNVFRIERSIRIDAAPEKVFSVLNDFHRWKEWSPWEKMDPELKRTYSGAEFGVGTIYNWDGNKKVGQGRMEILESQSNQKLLIKLDFFKPFEAHNTAEFILTAEGDSTHVNWAMYGPNILMSKIMSLFMNMDDMVGKDFEAGLSNLKAVAEKP